MFTLVKGLMKKMLNLNLARLLDYQDIKAFLQKGIFEMGLIKFLLLKKLKTLCRWNMLLVILKTKRLLERFTKNTGKKRAYQK